MPGLKLTLPQASRLFSIEPIRCERVLGALVHAGHLATDGGIRQPTWRPPLRLIRRTPDFAGDVFGSRHARPGHKLVDPGYGTMPIRLMTFATPETVQAARSASSLSPHERTLPSNVTVPPDAST